MNLKEFDKLFPVIVTDTIDKDKIYFVPRRFRGETVKEWARRVVILEDVAWVRKSE